MEKNTPEIKVQDCPVTLTLEEYKAFVTADILLRVLLAVDIGAYGSGNAVIDAARSVYTEVITPEREGNDNVETD